MSVVECIKSIDELREKDCEQEIKEIVHTLRKVGEP